VSAILDDWHRLTAEVGEEFRRDREMLSSHLVLPERRPRHWFAVLPHPTGWREIARLPELGIKVDLYTFNVPTCAFGQERPQQKLSVLLPVTNGYRRTFRALAGILYDIRSLLDQFTVDFHVCENFSDENSLYEVMRFARTLARAHAITVHVYHAEHIRISGDAARHGWRKTTVLNVMLTQILKSSAENNCDPNCHYLHFADDDIFILPGRNVVFHNINAIRGGAHVVSAAYSSVDTSGFSALTSVRKLPQYVTTADKLCNLYGGSMTTTVARLNHILGDTCQLPDDDGGLPEDCVLTIMANFLGGEGFTLAAFADPRNLVSHPEPANIVEFVRRVRRDWKWSRRTVDVCMADRRNRQSRDQLWDSFQQTRRNTFEPIGAAIVAGGVIRHVIAQRWNREIRDAIEINETKHDATMAMLERQPSVNWSTHMTRHQICKRIVDDPVTYGRILHEMEHAAFGYEIVRLMRKGLGHPSAYFSDLSDLLSRIPADRIQPSLLNDPDLYHWYMTAVESRGYAELFPKDNREVETPVLKDGPFPFDMEEVLEAVKNPLGNGPGKYFWRGLPTASYGHAAFVSWRPAQGNENADDRELYLKYYSVTGRTGLLRNSPRRIVFLQALGTELMTLLLADGSEDDSTVGDMISRHVEVKVVPTLYPTLQFAALSYAGPERRAPFDRLIPSIYIQKSLRKSTRPLAAVNLSEQDAVDVAAGLARCLGRLHGTTFGVRSLVHDDCDARLGQLRMPQSSDPLRVRLMRLVLSHLDQWRMFEPDQFKEWLDKGCDPFRREGSIPDLLSQLAEARGIVGLEVMNLMREDGITLEGTWRELRDESIECHREFGAVGHLGFTAANLLVPIGRAKIHLRKSAIDNIFVAHNSAVGIVDPAVEAAQVLAEVIEHRIVAIGRQDQRRRDSEASEDKSLFGIATAFCGAYQSAVMNALATANLPGRERDRHETAASLLPIRLSRIGALMLLARFNYTIECNLSPSQRTQLVHTCVDLLHAGTTLALRFPEARFLDPRDTGAQILTLAGRRRQVG